jgi:uncharacterized protein
MSSVPANTSTSTANTAPASAAPQRKFAAPRVLPETQAYWEAANVGQLLVKKCLDCGEFHHYPRDICPHCLSANTAWEKAAGTGKVYSFSTMGKGDAAYTMALVTLNEGVTMMTNLVDCDPTQVAIGQVVRVAFKTSSSGQAVPMFTPA